MPLRRDPSATDILAERQACADLVLRWAEEVEREKTTVGPAQLRLLAKAILTRNHQHTSPPPRDEPVANDQRHGGRVIRKAID